MPLLKLTAAQLSGPRPRKANTEYLDFVRGLKVGEGGKAIVADEKVSRQSVKNRLNKAAADLGVKIKFRHSSPEEVVFEVLAK